MKTKVTVKLVSMALKKISFKVSKGATVEDKARIMKQWYRKQPKIQIPPLTEKWEKIIVS